MYIIYVQSKNIFENSRDKLMIENVCFLENVNTEYRIFSQNLFKKPIVLK